MIRRVTHMVTVLAVLSVVLFYALHLMPGSPEEQWIASNPAITTEDVERLLRDAWSSGLGLLKILLNQRRGLYDSPQPVSVPLQSWPAEPPAEAGARSEA